MNQSTTPGRGNALRADHPMATGACVHGVALGSNCSACSACSLAAREMEWYRAASELLGHLSDVLPDSTFNLIDVTKWNALSSQVGRWELQRRSTKPGVPPFDPTKPCDIMKPHKPGDVIATECQRCKNPHHQCDQGMPT